MLTRDMLRYRVRRGEVHPTFIDPSDPMLLQHAGTLLQHAQEALAAGSAKGVLEDTLVHSAGTDIDLLLARGLRKLVMDLCTYAEPSDDAPALRAQHFKAGTALLRALPAHATRADFCARLHETCGAVPQLYSDLPHERILLAVKALAPDDLLQRYNMAQVQGLVMACTSFHLRAAGGDVRAVRRVLRWLKFCRLVAEVQRHDDASWHMQVTGPAAIFDNAKKYGLQLAMFVPVIPVLADYTLEAEIALRPGQAWQLKLSAKTGLVSPHQRRLGAMPQELQHLHKTFDDPHWQLETQAPPRPVGARDMMLPDFSCLHTSGRRVHVELFHKWHKHALKSRVAQLKRRPDKDLVLGIDKAILARDGVSHAEDDAEGIQSFVFNAFPTAKKVRAALQACIS